MLDQIGPYRVVAKLGEGGMGEVYRARDTKLNREVAIKILPEGLANDADRVARFEREAQMLATLNHPNIGAIYGFEDAGNTHALVLELVEGPTLADRIAQTPIPLDEALPIARQIAEALEAAHEHGIVHRDLKPSNIKVREDGAVKVLDFGLAKALEPTAGSGLSALGESRAQLSQSPTITSPALATHAGIILGTAAYMSPEQAKGKPLDKRTDIWAFGCVLYEMLSGTRAFSGDDVTDTLAFIITKEPDWSALPATTPSSIRRLLHRSFEKDRKRRLDSAAAVRLEIEEAIASTQTETTVAAPAHGKAGRLAHLWPLAAAALLVTTAALAGTVLYLVRSTEVPAVLRFAVSPPEKMAFNTLGGNIGQVGAAGSIAFNGGAVSPDGRKLAFTAQDSTGNVLLWIRPLDSLTAQPLQGTETAVIPFWSPDSRFIAFFASGKLKKIDITGGPPQTLCDAAGGRGGAWNRDGTIVFAPTVNGALFRVSAAGGEPTAVTKLQPGETAHRRPYFLPDGRHFLYRTYGTSPRVFVGSLDSQDTKPLLSADTQAIYSAGHLLFVRQGTLLAQPFDAGQFELGGEPFPVAERVATDATQGLGAFAVSENGVLTYRTGPGTQADVQLAWFDRLGKQIETVGTPAPYRGVDLSPNGTHVAVHRHDGNGGDVWLLELTRGTTSRLTFDAAQDNSSPVWSPDGSWIAFASLRNGSWGLYQKPSNNSGNDERIFDSASRFVAPMSWSPDGRSVVYYLSDLKTGSDLWVLPLTGDRKATAFAQASYNESFGEVSPDGRWLAYLSNETGRAEVYVRPFPSGPGKYSISTSGGTFPRWRRDGKEIFFLTAASGGKLAAVDVKASGATLEVGAPKALFDSGFVGLAHGGVSYKPYAVSADGQRFLIPRPPSLSGDDAPGPITVVVNWPRGLSARDNR